MIDSTPWLTFLRVWGEFLLLVLAGLLVAILVHLFIRRVVRGAIERSSTTLDDLFLRPLLPAFVVLSFLATIWLGLAYLEIQAPPEASRWNSLLASLFILLLVAPALARLIHGFLNHKAKAGFRWQRLATIGGRLAHIVIYALAFVILLDAYGIPVTPLITSLGIAGIAVALALQDTLGNFFAGLSLETDRAVRPGHYVRIQDNDVEGHVVEVGWRTTKIRTLPNNIVVIPNSKLAQSIITDYHLPDPSMSLLIPVRVSLDADPDHIEKVLLDEARVAIPELPGAVKGEPPIVRFIPGFGDYYLEFTLIVRVREFTAQFEVQDALRRRILHRFRREGIRIPLPTRENIQIPGTRAEPPAEPAD